MLYLGGERREISKVILGFQNFAWAYFTKILGFHLQITSGRVGISNCRHAKTSFQHSSATEDFRKLAEILIFYSGALIFPIGGNFDLNIFWLKGF